MDRLVSIDLFEGTRAHGVADVVALPYSVPLLAQVQGAPRIEHALGQAAQLALSLRSGTEAATSVGADGLMLLRARRVLRLAYESGAVEEFRILDVRRDLAGTSDVSVAAESLWWSDLAALYPRRRLATGVVDPAVVLSGQTAQEAFTALLSPELGSPAFYAAGDVAAALADRPIDLALAGETTLLQALRTVAEQSGGELEIRYDADGTLAGTADRYLVDLVVLAGMTAAETAAGEPDPDLRPVVMGPEGTNRRRATRTSDGRSFFTRLVPVAHVEDGVVTAAAAAHRIEAKDFDAGSNQTAITLESGTVVEAAAWPVGLALDLDGDVHEVVAVSGDAALVAGDLSGHPATHARIVTPEGGDVEYVADFAAETWAGRSERHQVLDAVPYPNLLAEAGTSSDLSDWNAGLPVGTALVGAPIATQIASDARYVRHGTRSVKVEAGTGEGIESAGIELTPTTDAPWVSVYVNVRVASGRVRVELADSAGTNHPEGQRAGSTADRLEAVAIEGITPAAGAARLRVVAEADATVFYLDAWTVTPSPTAWEHAPEMGPRALYAAATRLLVEEGGVQPDRYECDAFDESHFTGGLAPIRLGSFVRLRDGYNDATGSYDVDVASRVESITTYLDPIDGAVMKTFTLSRLRKRFTDLFDASVRRPRPWRVPNEDRAAVIVQHRKTNVTAGAVEVEVRARTVKSGAYELVRDDGTSRTVLGTIEAGGLGAILVETVARGAADAVVEYEAVQLGVAMSNTERVDVPKRCPVVTSHVFTGVGNEYLQFALDTTHAGCYLDIRLMGDASGGAFLEACAASPITVPLLTMSATPGPGTISGTATVIDVDGQIRQRYVI